MELVRNGVGICNVQGTNVEVKNHNGDTICDCSIDEFLGFGSMISAVFDHKNANNEVVVSDS